MISPTPWNVGVSLDRQYGNWPCYRLQSMTDSTDEKEIEDNRRLMEAAPKLLATCEALLDEHFIFPRGVEWVCPFCEAATLTVLALQHKPDCPIPRARATIAKATTPVAIPAVSHPTRKEGP